MQSKNILILSSHVPFSKGGAEVLVEKLCSQIRESGHRVDILSLPFICNSHDDLIKNVVQWRSLDLKVVNGRPVDIVICTKFPTYYVEHPHKVIWLIHQYRQAYELVATRFGDFAPSIEDESIRKAILRYDNIAFSESKQIYTISENVSKRLQEFNGVSSSVLEPPISNSIDLKVKIEKGNYILCVGRLSSIKRVDLIIRALPKISKDLNLVIVGKEDEPGILEYLHNEIEKNSLSHRVTFHHKVEADVLSQLYANAFCVYFGSYDEDFGFITYEAAAYKKPIITLDDSGHIASVVKRFQSGIVTSPHIESVAAIINQLLLDINNYEKLSENSTQVKTLSSWQEIVTKLTT